MAEVTDSGRRIGDGCEAIVAEFVHGPQICNEPSIRVVTDATWGTTHVVCAEHAPSPDTAADGSET